MGAINLDNTGSGGAITLSSDGTSLLLGGSAVGGGADLYAANESSPTAQPSATGTNAIAIGDQAVSSGTDSFAIGTDTDSTGTGSLAVGQGAQATANYNLAIGLNANATAERAIAIGNNGVIAGSTYSTAIGHNSGFGGSTTATGSGAMALGGSYASGADSFAAAIANNTSSYGATGANSIAIGKQAKAASTDSIAIGNGATATSAESLVLSTSTNYTSETTARRAVAIGYRALSSIRGKMAFAGHGFSANGDAQSGKIVLVSDTTDATPEPLTSNNNQAGLTDNQVLLPNNSAYSFHGTIVARESAASGTDCAAWKVEGLIRREGSAGTTVLVNSATTVLDNTPSWGMALSADTTNGGLAITVTGAASTNIRWVGTIHTSEVTYA